MVENFTNAEDLNKRTLVVQEKIKAGGGEALTAHFELNEIAKQAENFKEEAEKENDELNKKDKTGTNEKEIIEEKSYENELIEIGWKIHDRRDDNSYLMRNFKFVAEAIEGAKRELDSGEFKYFTGIGLIKISPSGKFIDFGIRDKEGWHSMLQNPEQYLLEENNPETFEDFSEIKLKQPVTESLVKEQLYSARRKQELDKDTIRILESPLQRKLFKLIERLVEKEGNHNSLKEALAKEGILKNKWDDIPWNLILLRESFLNPKIHHNIDIDEQTRRETKGELRIIEKIVDEGLKKVESK